MKNLAMLFVGVLVLSQTARADWSTYKNCDNGGFVVDHQTVFVANSASPYQEVYQMVVRKADLAQSLNNAFNASNPVSPMKPSLLNNKNEIVLSDITLSEGQVSSTVFSSQNLNTVTMDSYGSPQYLIQAEATPYGQITVRLMAYSNSGPHEVMNYVFHNCQ